MVDSIEANIESSAIRVTQGTEQLRKASGYQVCFTKFPKNSAKCSKHLSANELIRVTNSFNLFHRRLLGRSSALCLELEL